MYINIICMYIIIKFEFCYLIKNFNFGNLLVIWNLIKLLNIFIMIIIDIKNENIDFKLCFLKLKDINLFIVLKKKKILL